jgi:uncharacterized protein YfaS (alpha-2-macroglobulin family)
MLIKKFTIWFLLFSIYFGTIAPFGSTAQRTVRPQQRRPQNVNIPGNGLEFRLSEGQEGAENRQTTAPAKGESLSESETANLLKRLPPVKAEQDDQQDFAKRAGTLPAPKNGKIVPVKFPADEERGTPKINAAATLEVVRFSPEGEIPIAPELSVTFSQPMVSVTSQEQAAQIVPVRLTPEVKGKWRWLGTKTLLFDAEQRFPMATKFTATVPAGTKSATSAVLGKEVSWTFTTPAPKVLQTFPADQVTNRNPLMFVSFDQQINPQAVLNKINVSGSGKRLPLRLATQDEINADSSISYYAKAAQSNRWLAFRAVTTDGKAENALPGDSQISVTIEAGAPSAEGPLTTPKPQSFSFRTFGAMKFVRAYCGYQNNQKCSPFEPWFFEFSNPIDAAAFEKSLVQIEPNAEGLQIYPSGNIVSIQGYKPGRRAYKATIGGALKDSFGQILEKPATATFNVGAAEPSLTAQGGSFVVLDPTAKPNYSVYSINQPSLKVQVRAVTPEDWDGFRQFMRHLNYDEQKRPPLPGRVVLNKTVAVENKPDELVETRIDLSAALNEGFGHAIVFVEPTVKRDQYDRTKIVVWAEATQIGLDAFVDNQELVGFATDLKNGKPLDNVEMRIFPNNGTPISQQSSVNSDQQDTSNNSWWDWLTSFGTSEENIEENINEENAADSTNLINPQTVKNGLMRMALPDSQPGKPSLLIARRGQDVAFLPENSDYYWQDYGSWYKKPQSDQLRWFVFNDRNFYRPKEEVSIKGYIRVYQAGKFGDIAALGDAARGINYIVRDERGNEFAKGAANLNAFGAFDFKIKLPDNINLGYTSVEISTPSSLAGATTNHSFQVQEFRRPEFEVKAKNETEAPYFVGNSANVSVEAKYYAGGALANAETNWTVTATPTNYTPPNRDDFTFGKWFPWWRHYDEPFGSTSVQSFKGTTGADGKHVLKVDFIKANPPRPYNVRAEARVSDVNRQAWAAATNLLVHPADLYVGIRTNRTFVNRGEPFTVESITTDIDGKAVANRDVEIKAVLKDWQFDKGSWQQVTVDEQTCNIKSGENPVECKFTAKQGGVYTITASVLDDRERENESELTLWVSGGKQPPKRNVEQEEAQLVPDKKEYAAGDTAEILVMSPFVPAEGVLTLARNGIVKTERFTMSEASKVLRVPLEERYLPNINVQIDLVGSAERTNDAGEIDKNAPRRPAFASGSLNLPISIATRKLNVTAEPRAKNLEPGGETSVDVTVKDSAGNAVANSEVAVIVVDESVLALSNYSVADPASIFYTQRGADVSTFHSRKDVLLGNQKDLNAFVIDGQEASNFRTGVLSAAEMEAPTGSIAAPAPMAKMRAARAEAKDEIAQQPETPINLRENFNALAVFAASVKTDSAGKVTIPVKLPDNLTRYRVTAVSVTNGNRFGKGESNITARQPLMVRPSAPRFLNFGDKFELPVVVQNQTDNPLTVNVAVRATNAELTAGNGKQVTVPPNDRLEVRFPVSAVKAGTARFQIGVSSGKFADAAEISLPVWTPATTEAFATYGTIDANQAIVQPVEAPKDVFAQFGGLEVTTASTQLQELTDAFIYLQNYPYECTEQVASRMISIAALRDVLQAFKAEDMPSAEELQKRFAKDVEILKSRQREDGSFGMWGLQRERYEYPFVTVHTAHALQRAKEKGYKVPDEMLNKTKPYLKNVEKYYDKFYSPEVRWTISSYALYVRARMGDKDIAKAKNILQTATLQKLPFEATGWLLAVLSGDKNSVAEVESIRRFLMNRTTETAAAANFVTNYKDDGWVIMASNRRADGVILEAMISDQPNSDLIPKLVRGLLAHRKKGHWGNTQENVFILLALDKYFNTYEKTTPNFVAQVWLGNAYAGEQPFRGRSVDSKQIDVPMNYLLGQNGMSNLILNKAGEGRLYYRIGMKYAPSNLKLAPADYGFTVLRKYEAVDTADDVKQNADGSWAIKSGARVRVRLTMIAPSRRYHVALVDPLPAGLESLNPALAVTETVPNDTVSSTVETYGSQSFGRGYYWYGTWYEHQNLRDERAEAFSSLLWEGVWNYSYVCRATTPGEFVVPPAKAEEMYTPETFGRSGTDFVRVE